MWGWPSSSALSQKTGVEVVSPDWEGRRKKDRRTLAILAPTNKAASVLRAKGVCRVGPSGAPHVLQLVGRRWTLQPWRGQGQIAPGLVLIGTERLPPPGHLAALFSSTVLACSSSAAPPAPLPASLED